MARKPVILLAFAADPAHKYLEFLDEEEKTIKRIFVGHPWFDIYSINDATAEDVVKAFLHPDLGDRIVAFHYAGHADQDSLLMMDAFRAGATADVDAEDLAAFLRMQKSLELVFLNGCSTAEQVQALIPDIKHVIATKREIDDKLAVAFADYFYSALAKQPDIGEAFAQARSALQAQQRNLKIAAVRGIRFNVAQQKPSLDDWFWVKADDQYGFPISDKLRHSFLLHELRNSSKQRYEDLVHETGRFHFLNSNDENKGVMNTPLELFLTEEKEGKATNLPESLPATWQQQVRHAFITGSGGAGKTVSMMRLWQQYLEGGSYTGPLPLMIFADDVIFDFRARSRDILIKLVIKIYLNWDQNDLELVQELEEILNTPASAEGCPPLLLLFDGLDDLERGQSQGQRELMRVRDSVLKSLSKWSNQYSGVQLVISMEERPPYPWAAKFHELQLQKLRSQDVASYLMQFNVSPPIFSQVIDLLGNPLMLNLYAHYAQVKNAQASRRLDFKSEMSTRGEMLWNFVIARSAANEDGETLSYGLTQTRRFILFYFLPYVGFRLESRHKRDMAIHEFKDYVDEFFAQFENIEFAQAFFFESHPEFRVCINHLSFGELNELETIRRLMMVKDICSEGLNIVIEENERLRFTHRDFRDFFSALHVLDQLDSFAKQESEVSLVNVPSVIRLRPLPRNIRLMMADICGEHYNRPYLDIATSSWDISNYQPSTITRALDKLRCCFDHNVLGYSIWNLVQILIDSRKELTGMDLSGLFLPGISLNQVRCSRTYGENSVGINVDQSLADDSNFLPEGHTAAILSVAFQATGQVFATASSDYSIRLWSFSTKSAIHNFIGHDGPVTALAFHPYDEILASGSTDNKIMLWSSDLELEPILLEGHEGSIIDLAWVVQYDWLISSSADRTLRVWSYKTRECIYTYPLGKYMFSCVTCDDKGRLILAGSKVGELRILSLKTGKCLKIVELGRSITSISFSPISGQNHFLLAYNTGVVEIWQLFYATDTVEEEVLIQKLKSVKAHDEVITDVQWHPTKPNYITADRKGKIKLWPAEESEHIQEFKGHSRGVTSTAFHPGGAHMVSVSGDRSMRSWALESGSCEHYWRGFPARFHAMDCHPKGDGVLVGGEAQTVEYWSLDKKSCQQINTEHQAPVTALSFLPDGKSYLSGDAEGNLLWVSLMTGKCLQHFDLAQESISAIACHYKGNIAISGGKTGALCVWSIKTGKCIDQINFHLGQVNKIIFHHNRKQVLSAGEDGAIHIWDLVVDGYNVRLEKSYELIADDTPVYSMDISQDGNYLLAADKKGALRWWSLPERKTLMYQQFHHRSIMDVVLLPEEGRAVTASADCNAKLVSIKSKKIERNLKGHKHQIKALALYPDRKHVITASLDGEIKYWRLRDGECLFTLRHTPGMIFQNSSLKDLHKNSNLSAQTRNILENYQVEL